MVNITKITEEEARKLYNEKRRRIARAVKEAKKLMYYSFIVAGFIGWSTLFGWGAIAYAGSSETAKEDLWSKDYTIKSKTQDSKAIQQFPKDVINLATVWREIPKTAYNIRKDEGTIRGITLGPIKGTATIVKNVSKGVWHSLNSDKDQQESKGLVFNYKF